MTGQRVPALALVVLLVAVAPAGAASTGEVAPTAPTEIDGCATIVEPGEYVLGGDVENESPPIPEAGLGACIRIRADDVVLRGGGNAVVGENRGGVVGVLVGGDVRRSNVTVENLTVTGWGAGVAVMGVADATLRNVSAVANLGDGFYVESAPDAAVLDGTVRGSNTGIFLHEADRARVDGASVESNLAGIDVHRSDGAALRGVDAAENRRYGIGLFESANASVADSTLRANEFAGAVLSRSDDARLRTLSIATNPRQGAGDPVGVYLNNTEGARLADVSVADDGGVAVFADDSTVAGERVRVGAAAFSFEARDVALRSAADPPPLPTDRNAVGDSLVAVPTGGEARLSLSVLYADAAVDRARTTEDALSLWRFDAGEGWRRVETTVDAERNVASAAFAELDENGTVVSLAGEGFAEAANATG